MNQDFQSAVQYFNTGKLERAGKLCRKVLSKRPKHAQSLHLMGLIAHQEGDPESANVWYGKAVVAKPDYAEAHNSLGASLLACGKFDDSVESFLRAVAIYPNYARALGNLGIVLKDCGFVEESINILRRALAAQPAWHEVHSNLLLTHQYLAETDSVLLLEKHLTWDRIHAGHLASFAAPHNNNRATDRRLRVGFVSPDIRDHPVIHFLMPFLENYDRNQIELFVYSQVADLDEWTEMASKHVDHWRSLVHVRDVEAATLIRSDQIDILVDLAGHTNGNRLLVFAHKPAPIQVTYLGYPDTSGLAAMDYRITDALADPPGMTENHNTEQLIRLPGCAWCYGAYSDIMPSKSPAAMNKYITFGSFNNLAKVNDRMLRVWARILEAVPGSRLLLKAAGFRSMEARKRVREIFFLHSGIDEDRLDFRLPEEKHESHLALYGEMDIALDTFPYHGTTTTCEALWMGVPVVILEGKSHVSRVGVSLLTSIGLPEMVAVSEDEYVKIAVTLAGNVELLKSHRENLRGKLQNSRLLDGISFSRDLESVFRQMWKLWALNV